MYEYYINDFGQKVFLPACLDKSQLIDVSNIGDEYATFVDQKTGVTHFCDAHLRFALENLDNIQLIKKRVSI